MVQTSPFDCPFHIFQPPKSLASCCTGNSAVTWFWSFLATPEWQYDDGLGPEVVPRLQLSHPDIIPPINPEFIFQIKLMKCINRFRLKAKLHWVSNAPWEQTPYSMISPPPSQHILASLKSQKKHGIHTQGGTIQVENIWVCTSMSCEESPGKTRNLVLSLAKRS